MGGGGRPGLDLMDRHGTLFSMSGHHHRHQWRIYRAREYLKICRNIIWHPVNQILSGLQTQGVEPTTWAQEEFGGHKFVYRWGTNEAIKSSNCSWFIPHLTKRPLNWLKTHNIWIPQQIPCDSFSRDRSVVLLLNEEGRKIGNHLEECRPLYEIEFPSAVPPRSPYLGAN